MTISPGKHFSSSKSKLRLTVAQLNGGGGGGGSQWCRLSEHREQPLSASPADYELAGTRICLSVPITEDVISTYATRDPDTHPKELAKAKGIHRASTGHCESSGIST